jgi:hypothetical protein
MRCWTPSCRENLLRELDTFNSTLRFQLVTRSCQASSVSCVTPPPSSHIGGGDRQDLVFARPPGARDFRLSLETVWFFRVLLFFSFVTETDTEIKRHECAFVSLLWEYDEGRPGEKYLLSLLNTSKFIYIYVF